jgi:TMEM175 potassium channel family protein
MATDSLPDLTVHEVDRDRGRRTQREPKESWMMTQEATPDRLSLFSDAVFAVIITILALELKPPHSPSFEALTSLWPTAVSYAVSYLFIAIVWVNHHHLLRYAEVATSRLIWGNFAHLFTVSLMPFSTAWIAQTNLAGVPVSLYAGVFVLVNATYLLLCVEAVDRSHSKDVPQRMRMMMRVRSLVTLGLFATAAVVALKYPIAGMALICLCLLVYLRPEAPGIKT